MKIILNKCYGGFGLSAIATLEYAKKKNVELYCYKYVHTKKEGLHLRKCSDRDILNNSVDYYFTEDQGYNVDDNQVNWATHYYLRPTDIREDMDLIDIVEGLGKKASGRYAQLRVVEIPDSLRNNYDIDDYDGVETLHERVNYY